MTTMEPDIYYDPYDFEIDSDPYPGVEAAPRRAAALLQRALRLLRPQPFRRRRPLLARLGELHLEQGHPPRTHKERHGTPPGSIIFEDPPAHNIHRRLLSRVFTPRNINDLEPKIREFCARSLDPLVGTGRVRLHRGPRRPDAHAHHRHVARHPRTGPGGHPRPDRPRPAAHGERHARPRHHVRGDREPRGRIRGVHRMAGDATRPTT